MLVKWKWLIVGLAVVVAFGALIHGLRQPKLYKATATLMSVDGGGGGLMSALSAVPFFGGGGGSEGKLIPILKSYSLAQQVAQGADLQEYFPRLAQNKDLNDEQKLQSVAAALRGGVKPQNKDGLLHVSVIWSDPEAAAKFANLYVKHLGKFLNQRSLNVNFHVIDSAVVPSASFNKRGAKKSVMIGAGIGLFCGVFLAFFFDYLQKIRKLPA